MNNILEFDYPVKRRKYCKVVGELRVSNIAEILHDLGYTVLTNPIEANDVDVTVFYNGKLICVMEVLNWNETTSFMDTKRKESIIKNLSKYPCVKVLVCSFISNLKDYIDEILDAGINILEIGFETVPLKYYLWFKKRGIEYDKKALDRHARILVRNKLSQFFAYVYEYIGDLKALERERRLNRGVIYAKSGYGEIVF